jgi:DNA gyrase subunit A
MLVTANGVVTRINAGSISRQGRPATGVRAQNLNDGDSVVSVNKILNPDEDDVTIKSSISPETNAIEPETQQTSLLDESLDEDVSSEE